MPFRSGPGLRRRRSAPSTPICGASPWSPSGGRSLLRRSCYGRYGHHDISTCPCDVICAVLQRVGSLGARLTVCFPIDSQFQSVSPSAGEAGGTRRDRSEFISPLDVRDRAVHERGPVQGAAPEDAAQLDVVSRGDREDRGSAVSRPDTGADLVLAEVRGEGPQDEDVHTRRRDLALGPAGRATDLIHDVPDDRRAFADDTELAGDREGPRIHAGRLRDEPLVRGDRSIALAVRAVTVPAQVVRQANRTLHRIPRRVRDLLA